MIKIKKVTVVSLLLMGLSSQGRAEEWKIGVLTCLTGPCATDGTNVMRGLELAAEDINGSGGVLGRKIRLVPEDTEDAVSGARAVTAFKKLRTDSEIRTFVGPCWTPGGLSLAPFLKREADILMTTTSLGVPEFHESSPGVFNARGIDEGISRLIARQIRSLGVSRVAVFSTEQPWESAQAKCFRDEFLKSGGEIVGAEESLPTAVDISQEVLRLLKRKPEAVFSPSYVKLAKFAQELKRYNFTGRKFAFYIDDEMYRDSDSALEGFVFFPFPEAEESFRNRYLKRYGTEPLVTAGFAYDTLHAYAKAAVQAGTIDPVKLREELRRISFDGVSGRFDFQGRRFMERRVEMSEMREGKRTALRE